MDHNIFDDASNIHNVSQNIVFQAVNQSIIMRVIFALTSRYKQQSALGSLIYSNSKFTRKTFKKNTHTNYQIRQINKFEICIPSTLRVSFENTCKQENSEKSESRPIYNFVTTKVGEERVRAISTNRGGRHECMNIFIEVSKEN